MKKFKLKIMFIILGVVLVLGGIGISIYFILGNKMVSSDDEKFISSVIDKVDISDDDKVLETVKANVVRVINKVGNDKIVGSGFFVEDGYLVTNSHVVDIKGDITIQYSDGVETEASLVSNDITSDVALLTVKDVSALAMNFGNTLNVKITDDLYAVGYAVNLAGEASITKGILSARRSMAGIEYLQTDAAINSGFSGGPLLNKNGEVVGLNSLANDNATIGMSISSESLQNIIDKLIDDKKVNYLETDRPSNALSSVLKEVGYELDDLYGEWKYFHKGEEKPVQKEEEKKPQQVYIPSSNCELSYLGVNGYDIGWNSNSVKFQLYFTNNEDKLDIVVTPKDKKAKYRIVDNENLRQSKDGVITIIVTAEDGNHKKEYYIVYHNVKSTIDGLKSVNISSGIGRDYQNNTNVLQYNFGFVDVDGMHIDGYFKINYLKVDLYVCNNGTLCQDGDEGSYVPLKTYNFYQDYRVEREFSIQLSEIKNLINNGNYFVDGNSKVMSKATLVTMNQGSYYQTSYHTFSQ